MSVLVYTAVALALIEGLGFPWTGLGGHCQASRSRACHAYTAVLEDGSLAAATANLQSAPEGQEGGPKRGIGPTARTVTRRLRGGRRNGSGDGGAIAPPRGRRIAHLDE